MMSRRGLLPIVFGLVASGLVASVLAVAASAAAFAQPASDYYRGKQIRMIVGHPVGNDYDLGARFLAKYLTRHIPGNPLIVVSNMPAASSVAAANFLYTQAPRDGTVLGSFSRNIPSQALMRQANLDIDPRRYSWIGGTALPGRVCAAWHTAKVRTPADLLTTELIVGGGGSGSSLSILPTVLNHVLGTKFRLVEGYKGTNDTVIAMERGEVEGVCATYGQFRVHERALKEGKLRLILRAEESPIAAVPGGAVDLRPHQDRGAASTDALRVLQRRVRPALCAAARLPAGTGRADAQGVRRCGQRSRADRRGGTTQARHDLSSAR